MSDDSGELVIKPCTPAEVAFYEAAFASHPKFAYFIPQFMGTLQLGDSTPTQMGTCGGHTAAETSVCNASGVTDLKAVNLPGTHAPSSSVPGASLHRHINDPGPLKGKKLDTDLHIVLENIAARFKQPNILDLKLGARLWDEDAKPEKRARLDKVSGETTSGSLGFRIAGMRVWQGRREYATVSLLADVVAGMSSFGRFYQLDEDTNVRNYNKFYGRHFNADNVIEGFREYLLVPSASVDRRHALLVAQRFLEDVSEIQTVLETHETRMYSSSILLVYEGDPDAFQAAVTAAANPQTREEKDEDDEDEDGDEEELSKFYAVKLIDFAHASFQSGIGPDENMLQGVRSTVKILEQLVSEFKD